MAIFGGRPAVSIPPSGGGGPLWPSSRNVNCGIDQPPGYEGKKHRPLHRAASVWAKRRLAAGTVDSRFSQRTGPANRAVSPTPWPLRAGGIVPNGRNRPVWPRAAGCWRMHRRADLARSRVRGASQVVL